MSSDETADAETIKDAEDIVIERRLTTIFDIRRELHQLRSKFRMGRIDDLSEEQVLSGYRTLADNYLMEIHPLLLKFDRGEELLNEYDFGVALVQPKIFKGGLGNQKELRLKFRDFGTTYREPRAIKGRPDKRYKKFELEGLRSLWELDDPLTATFAIPTFDAGTQATMPEEFVIRGQIGFDELDHMVRRMNVFLSEIGFELEPDDGNTVAQADYSDIV